MSISREKYLTLKTWAQTPADGQLGVQPTANYQHISVNIDLDEVGKVATFISSNVID